MFRIGEFSKIAQVSGRLLRYYDEIGLLSPDYTDSQTGYRYYSAKQLPQLNRILVLKELGLSLEQIAQMLTNNTSTEEIRGMLTLRKAQIEQTVQEEMARLRMGESRLQQIDSRGQIEEPDVVIKSVSAQPFLSLREVLPRFDDVKRLVLKISGVVPSVVAPSSLVNIAVLIHSSVFDPDALDLEIGYLLTAKGPASVRLSEERVLTLRELPAVETVASVVHIGQVEDRHRGYGELGNWLEQNQYEITGTLREVLLQLPMPGNPAQAVTELQIPVRKADSARGA